MISKKISLRLVTYFVVSATFLAAGCSGGSSSDTPAVMTIAHINDHHSNLEPPLAAFEFTLGGVKTQADVGGMARMSEAFLKYQGRSDVLKLHAGDAITGTSYFTFFSGEACPRLSNAA